MFRISAGASLATLAIGATALLAASFVTASPAEAFGSRYERSYERPSYGWRPPPPVVHGYWGQRRWQRYNDGFRAPPPARYGYGYGWR
jgi:hypothetical protein